MSRVRINCLVEKLLKELSEDNITLSERFQSQLDNLITPIGESTPDITEYKPDDKLKETEGLKIEPGMMLVYTSAEYLSRQAKEDVHKMLEAEVYQALCQVPRNLLIGIGIVILNPGSKLEILSIAKPELDGNLAIKITEPENNETHPNT